MKNTITFSLISIFALAPVLALADARADLDKVDAALEQCLNKQENMNTLGINKCMRTAYAGSDRILNQVYKGIVTELKKPTGDKHNDDWNKEVLNRLVKSERSWIAFRDTDSSLNSIEMLGGTGEAQIFIDNLHEMTKTRALQLNALLGGRASTLAAQTIFE